MRRTLVSLFIGLSAVCSAMAQVPSGDLQALEAAKASGSRQQVITAARQLAASAMAHPEDPEAGRIAYSAGWLLCINFSCRDAIKPGKFAATRSDAPIDAVVLAPFAEYRVKVSKKSKRALAEALSLVEASEPTDLTLSAFRELYSQSQLVRDSKATAEWASRAHLHFGRGGEPYAEYYYESLFVQISAEYEIRPRSSQIETVVRASGELARRLLDSPDSHTDWVERSYWEATGWAELIRARLESEGRDYLSRADAEAMLKLEYTGDRPLPPRTVTKGLRVCDGHLIAADFDKEPILPGGYASFGAFVIKFSLRNGEVINPEIIAALPRSGLTPEQAESRIARWRFEPQEDPATANCALDAETGVLTLIVRTLRGG
ncbi:MAG: hypothetical protein IPK75_06990 [Acidobacteria bacterium]|nr:hypothetical protein [Acidobacteriota bacterium]